MASPKKNQQPAFRWNSKITSEEIKACTDYSWYLYRSFTVPHGAEFLIKAGNKDYALELDTDNTQKQKLSEFALKKKHGLVLLFYLIISLKKYKIFNKIFFLSGKFIR